MAEYDHDLKRRRLIAKAFNSGRGTNILDVGDDTAIEELILYYFVADSGDVDYGKVMIRVIAYLTAFVCQLVCQNSDDAENEVTHVCLTKISKSPEIF